MDVDFPLNTPRVCSGGEGGGEGDGERYMRRKEAASVDVAEGAGGEVGGEVRAGQGNEGRGGCGCGGEGEGEVGEGGGEAEG